MKIKITDIIEWTEDIALTAGDASHNGNRAVQHLLEEERMQKIDNNKALGLPFICDAENEDDALEKYNNAHCKYDYLKAIECDWERINV